MDMMTVKEEEKLLRRDELCSMKKISSFIAM